VHDVTFGCEDPGAFSDAAARPDGTYEVPPEANLGTRLVLVPAYPG
jgi:hypothetical protein